MKITEDMMTTILKEIHTAEITSLDKQAEFIVSRINQAEQILNDIDVIHKNQNTIDEQYKRQKQDLNAAITKIQNECPHYDTTYYPDPTGNNDSFYECRLCGKEIR